MGDICGEAFLRDGVLGGYELGSVNVEGFEGSDEAVAVAGEVCKEAFAVGEAEHDHVSLPLPRVHVGG